MIIVQQELKRLMRLNKSELKKLLRQTGKAANEKLFEYQSSGKWNRLPIETRNLVNTWLHNKKHGKKFYVAPRIKLTKKQLAMMIIQQKAWLEIKAPYDDESIDDDTAAAADSFTQFYDPSEFWGVYYAQYSHSMSKSAYWDFAHELAKRAKDAEEFYNLLRSGGFMGVQD